MKYIGISKFLPTILLTLFLLGSIDPPLNLPFGFPRTTWGVMKIGILVLFLTSTFQIWKTQRLNYLFISRNIFIFPFFFLFAVTVSLLLNPYSYSSLKSFEYLGIGALFYFFFSYYFPEDKVTSFFWILFFLVAYSTTAGILILIMSHYSGIGATVNLLGHFFPLDGLTSFFGDIDRNRLQSLWIIEAASPAMLYFLIFSDHKKKLFGVTGLILLFIAVLLSNNRYQFVALFFGFASYLFIVRKQITHKDFHSLKKLSLLVIPLAISGIIVSNYFFNTNLLDRFLLRDYKRDVQTIELRTMLYRQSLDLFFRFPLVGIGWGRFSDFNSPDIQFFSDPNWRLNTINQYYSNEPHNIFFQILAETGIIGFCAFLILLSSFLWQDWRLFHRLSTKEKIICGALIASFWTYFVDEQFTFLISDSLKTAIFAWTVRGILAGWYTRTEKEPREEPKKIMIVTNGANSHGGVELEAQRLKQTLEKKYQTKMVYLGRRHTLKGLLTFINLNIHLWRYRPQILISYYQTINILSGLSVAVLPFRTKLIVCEMNNPSSTWFITKKVNYLLTNYVYNHIAHTVIAASHAISTELTTTFSIQPRLVVDIPCSIDSGKIKKLSLAKTERIDSPYFIYMGRFSPEKRIPRLVYLFNSYSRRKRVKLYLVGDGPDREAIEKQIKKLRAQNRIFIIDWVTNPFPLLKHAKGLIIYSSTEGLPHVILEAITLNTPVITTYYPGVSEVSHLGNVRIVGLNNRKELLRALDLVLCKKNKRTSASTVPRQYTWQYNQKRYLKVLKSL